MERLVIFAFASLALSAAALSTPVDEMVEKGFSCDPGARGEIICKKVGSPSKICNVQGNCFRIVYDGGISVDNKIMTGSVIGHGYSNTEY